MNIYGDCPRPQESALLAALNIQPENIQRKSNLLFDVRFDYEKRYLTDQALGGKTVKVTEIRPGKPPKHSSFTMPAAGTLEKVRASAWLPLLVLGLIHERHTSQLCRMAWGDPLPSYAGDWSFIRDMSEQEIWSLFLRAKPAFMPTPANYAQP